MRPTPTAAPTRFTLAFRLKPIRTIQSYVEISLFPLDETFIPSTVNITFLSFRVRGKFSHERGGHEESCSVINPGRRGADCCRSDSPGAAAESPTSRLCLWYHVLSDLGPLDRNPAR